MSSTNRGYERHKTDYYITPKPAIRDFLKAIEPFYLIKGKILDCCAGGDVENDMSYPSVINELYPDLKVDTMDIREDSRAEIKGDYLEQGMTGYDVIITNPPFYLAKEIIQKALSEINMGGVVVMLLRLNFLGSQDRKVFLQENMPNYAYVHSKRMSFTKDGGTDSVEYMHAIWIKGQKVDFTKLKII